MNLAEIKPEPFYNIQNFNFQVLNWHLMLMNKRMILISMSNKIFDLVLKDKIFFE